jgi:hypothetical protein
LNYLAVDGAVNAPLKGEQHETKEFDSLRLARPLTYDSFIHLQPAGLAQRTRPHTDEWAAVTFLRQPGCVPYNFNLLDVIDVPGAFGCPLTVEGFAIFKNAPPPQTIESLRAAMTAVAPASGRSEMDVRLADVVVAWNVFRHFYPYWTEAQVDWDGRLPTDARHSISAACSPTFQSSRR